MLLPPPSARPSSATLVRGLTLTAAISVIIANTVGTGVFAKARVMTCNVGTPEMVILVWVVAGLLSLAGALTYGELAAMMPKAGGEVNYLTAAYGRRWGFLYGWMQLFVGKAGSQAAVAVFFADSLNDLAMGAMSAPLVSLGGWGLSGVQLAALGVLALATALNLASVRSGGTMATVLTATKIALVVGVGVFALWLGHGSTFGQSGVAGTCEGVSAGARLGLAGFSAAMLGALWGYDGWNNLTLVAGEVKNPQRNLPRGLFLATLAVMAMYVFINVGYYFVMSPAEIASLPASARVGTEVVRRLFGDGGAAFMSAALVVSSFATLHSSILSGSRVPYALASEGLLPKAMAQVNPKTHIPTWSVVLPGIWAGLLALSGKFDTLTDYMIFGGWVFYAVTIVAVFVLRRKHPDWERPYKAWGYPVVPVLFLLVAGFLLLSTLTSAWPEMASGFQALGDGQVVAGLRAILGAPPVAGLLLIALGLPVYAYYARQQATRTPEG